MWVRSNKINVTNKLITPKVYEEHATHVLLETQVNMTFSYNPRVILVMFLQVFKTSMWCFLHSKYDLVR
jgi:hypothetical protein